MKSSTGRKGSATPARLKAVVKAAGRSAKKVGAYLADKQRPVARERASQPLLDLDWPSLDARAAAHHFMLRRIRGMHLI